jgi:mRNA interferase MazF
VTEPVRGEVVWYPAIFAEYDRPFLVVSTDVHPFHGEEYIGLPITTTELSEAIPIAEADWDLGTLPEQSYVKPWNPAVLKAEEIQSVAGALHRRRVDQAADTLASICGLDSGSFRD